MANQRKMDPPQGFIRVWDSSSGLMGNYVVVRDTPSSRQAFRDKNHPIIEPTPVPHERDDGGDPYRMHWWDY